LEHNLGNPIASGVFTGAGSSQYSNNVTYFHKCYLPLILRSWPVFVYAIIISVESIFIEFLTNFLHLPPVLLSAISITLAGLLLLLIKYFIIDNKHTIKQKATVFSISKMNLLYASLALAVGVATWYDSVSRIGASKEVLLAGPLEVVLIVLLARMFLKERLDKIQIAGVIIAITGFIIAVLSDVNSIERVIKASSEPIITFGDIEAIISAFGFALGVLFLTKLVSKHSSIEVAGASLLLSGILIGVLVLFSFQDLAISSQLSPAQAPRTIIILILFSLLPFVGALSYSVGLSRIGAALTGTIGASNIVITFAAQITLRELGIMANHLPENIILAVLGSLLGFCGIVIIHMREYYYSPITKQRR
jgi:drug/metabolite transporter (DMT)-like permease